MYDFKTIAGYRDDLVRKIEYHQKMNFELLKNLEEMDWLLETKQYKLAKDKIGV